ncbi:hypothetical protein HAX54_053100 [Datura stramonium]|uniref:Uncharacterized protein n=1 Tax=Datura stramonium TaxID=4076 RepID=A0ABS8RRR6_DATST|nr:hypothetical protein [Datura stramonium]
MMTHTFVESSEILDKITKTNKVWHTIESEAATVSYSKGMTEEQRKQRRRMGPRHGPYQDPVGIDHHAPHHTKYTDGACGERTRQGTQGLTKTLGVKAKEIKVGTTMGIITMIGLGLGTKVNGGIEMALRMIGVVFMSFQEQEILL